MMSRIWTPKMMGKLWTPHGFMSMGPALLTPEVPAGGGGTPPVRESFTESGQAVAQNTVGTNIASVAVGDMLLVCVRWYGTQTVTSVTCNAESNLTAMGAVHTNGPNNGRMQWYVLSSATAAGTKLVTANWSANVNPGTFVCWRLSSHGGIDQGGGTDSTGNTGSGGTPSVSRTTTVDNCGMFVAGIFSDSDKTFTGFTAETLANTFYFDSGAYDLDVGAAGSKTATASATDSLWVVSAATVKPA